jgi:NAD(P)-dependent dehydrogenase (short-subunit alcohol dehydrogenase family)
MSAKKERPPVLVIGAGGDVGRAISRLLIESGLPVVIADASAESLEATRAQLGIDRRFVRAFDASQAAEVTEQFEALKKEHGALSALVNAQGVAGRGLIADVSPEQWERVLRINLSSVFYTCQAAVPLLRGVPRAAIVNIASVAGLREQAGSLAYATSKAAVVMFSRTLAAELARDDIRVHAVCPTAIDSAMVRAAMSADELASYAAAQPMGRLISVDEIGHVVLGLIERPLPYSPEPLVI